MASTQAETALDLKPVARGRRDSEGMPAVIDLKKVKDKEEYLIKLHNKAEESATDYKEGINKVAEAAGINAPTLSKYIKAKAGDKFEETNQKVQQLALVFEECGGG